MVEISVLMSVMNAEKYVDQAIESILKQSFSDFELIIVDLGSTDATRMKVCAYSDPRIKLIEPGEHIDLSRCTGRYVAFMNASDVMNIDRLNVQRALMENSGDMALCSSSMLSFGDDKSAVLLQHNNIGLLEQPLVNMLKFNPIYSQTAFVRKDFLVAHNIDFIYGDAFDDFRLWFEIARAGGLVYIESQPLVNNRRKEVADSNEQLEEQYRSILPLRYEILNLLIERASKSKDALSDTLSNFNILKDDGLMSDEDTLQFFVAMFSKNKELL